MTEANNDGAMANNASSYSGYNNVFNKIEKFEGKGDTDFGSWLRTFERACTIAQKNDDLVKGQLLMLCLVGQALAVAEQLEEEKSQQQKFSELKTRLESVFNTTANKESKMVEFENRIQRVEETEDEFMLSLVKMYRAANPDATEPTSTLAIKRKFMHGISPDLRRSIYIFCNEPYAPDVNYQKLLENARKARLQITQQQLDETSITAIDESNQQQDLQTNLVKALDNLEKNFNERMDSLERRYNERICEVNAIDINQNISRNNSPRGNYRRRGNYRFYNNGACQDRSNANPSIRRDNSQGEITRNNYTNERRNVDIGNSNSHDSSENIRCYR